MAIFYKKSDIPDHLQKYFVPAEIGLEQTPEEYIAAMIEVFRCVRDVLADDGTLWLNLGDSYGAGKQLLGIPWRVALALQADGWVLRQDIIWHKPNPMPESVRDRCTKAHEYIFLLSKSERYYYDQDAISEPIAQASIARLSQPNIANQMGSDRVPGKTNGTMKAVVRSSGNKERKQRPGYPDSHHGKQAGSVPWEGSTRNKRSVWTVSTKPYKGAHFATFPTDLIEPCILAGSRGNDIVLDPFMGSGTTAAAAVLHGRQYIGCELNPNYWSLQQERIRIANESIPRHQDLFEGAA